MIRSTDIQPDTYKSGAFLRRWSISEASGQAVCVEDAYAVADTEQATLDAQTERNGKIKGALADVEELEAARRVAEPDAETPRTVTVTDFEGNESTEPQAEWAAYDAAQATISDATNLMNDFEVVRRGQPAETLPVMKTIEETIVDEEGNETTRSVEVVDVEAEPTANPEFAEWQAAWTSVGALNG